MRLTGFDLGAASHIPPPVTPPLVRGQGERGSKRSTVMKLGSVFIVMIVKLAIVLPIVGFCFDYVLQNTFDKDVPWYADVVAGLFASPVTVPGTVILWILKLCGVAMPLVHQ